MSASWLRPVCGGFHNLIRFNCAPFFASCRRHRVLTVTDLDACRCAAYLKTRSLGWLRHCDGNKESPSVCPLSPPPKLTDTLTPDIPTAVYSKIIISVRTYTNGPLCKRHAKRIDVYINMKQKYHMMNMCENVAVRCRMCCNIFCWIPLCIWKLN
jgi:hypothetical protein